MIRKIQDDGVSSVIGAILVMAILGTSIVYVNSYRVPKEGATMETTAATAAELALTDLAAGVASSDDAVQRVIPLAPDPAAPPLLSGLILTPARAPGSIALNATATTITISHLTDAPAGGVPAGDPMRAAENGRMRVYTIGNATAGMAPGALVASVGGAYGSRTLLRLEAGALLSNSSGRSALVALPPIRVAASANGSSTSFHARVPIFAGSAVSQGGAQAASVRLTPGPEARAGGGSLVYNVTISVRTDALAAWTSALSQIVGARGTVASVLDAGASDTGTVTALVLPPIGTPAGTKAVELDVAVLRYTVDLAAGSIG